MAKATDVLDTIGLVLAGRELTGDEKTLSAIRLLVEDKFAVSLTSGEIEDLRLGLALLIGECPPDQSPEPIFRLDNKLAALADESERDA